jgi:hypothetical protein
MKLALRSNPAEVFDAPRGIALALLQIPNSPVVQPLPPAPRVLKPQSHWSIVESLNQTSTPFAIHVHCDSCKNVGSGSGPTIFKTMRYCHCGIVETVPAEIAARYARLIAQSQASQERPRRVPGIVTVI